MRTFSDFVENLYILLYFILNARKLGWIPHNDLDVVCCLLELINSSINFVAERR